MKQFDTQTGELVKNALEDNLKKGYDYVYDDDAHLESIRVITLT